MDNVRLSNQHRAAKNGELSRSHPGKQQVGHNLAPVLEVSQSDKSSISYNQAATQIELANKHNLADGGDGNGNVNGSSSQRAPNTTRGALWPTDSASTGQFQTTRAQLEPIKGLASLVSQGNEHLIQIAILIGSLLGLILFTSLLVRRLFLNSTSSGVKSSSNYHWMLAKQTRRDACLNKAKGKRSYWPDRQSQEQLSVGLKRHICSLESSSSGDTTTTTATIVPNYGHRLAPPHHMCHLWNGRQKQSVSRHTQGQNSSPSFSSSLCPSNKTHQLTLAKLQQQQHQLFVDVKGRHFLASELTASPTRQIDAAQDSAALYTEPTSYYYLAPHKSSTGPKGNCDTGHDHSYNQEHDETMQIIGSAQQMGDFSDSLPPGSICSSAATRRDQIEGSWRIQAANRALSGNIVKKLTSPKVEEEFGCVSLANQYNASSAKLPASKSPSISSAGDESCSSLSVQSTTAQLLSNSQSNSNGPDVSSSLEQAVEIEDGYGSPAVLANKQATGSTASSLSQSSMLHQIDSTNVNGCSPASSCGQTRLGGHRRQASSCVGGIVGLALKCSVQSRPSSPKPSNNPTPSSAIKRQHFKLAGRCNWSSPRASLASNSTVHSVQPQLVSVPCATEEDDERHFYEEINSEGP